MDDLVVSLRDVNVRWAHFQERIENWANESQSANCSRIFIGGGGYPFVQVAGVRLVDGTQSTTIVTTSNVY